MTDVEWAFQGEWVLSCIFTEVCPRVISRRQTPPTKGYCQSWSGFPVNGGSDRDTVIPNSEDRIAPDIFVARSARPRLRAVGRNWNFAVRLAETCARDLSGPN